MGFRPMSNYSEKKPNSTGSTIGSSKYRAHAFGASAMLPKTLERKRLKGLRLCIVTNESLLVAAEPHDTLAHVGRWIAQTKRGIHNSQRMGVYTKPCRFPFLPASPLRDRAQQSKQKLVGISFRADGGQNKESQKGRLLDGKFLLLALSGIHFAYERDPCFFLFSIHCCSARSKVRVGRTAAAKKKKANTFCHQPPAVHLYQLSLERLQLTLGSPRMYQTLEKTMFDQSSFFPSLDSFKNIQAQIMVRGVNQSL